MPVAVKTVNWRKGGLLLGRGSAADLVGQHGAAEVDLHEPVAEGIVGRGLPEGLAVAVDDSPGCGRVATGFPDPARRVGTACASEVGEVGRVGYGV